MADVVDEEFLDDEDTQKDKFMTFMCGDESYGIGIEYVNEIIGMQKITEVPETEGYIKGLINLRGKIIPVIDVRLRFGKPQLEYNDRTCIIKITVGEVVVGLVVDTIADVVNISSENIVPPPKLGKSNDNRFIYGIGKIDGEVKLLIDPDKLINDTDKEKLANMS